MGNIALPTWLGKTSTLRNVDGGQYDTINPEQILALVRNPTKLPKSQARYCLAGDASGQFAREAMCQIEHGQYRLLPVDIDKGNHSLDAVIAAIKTFLPEGTEFFVYSTSSATADDKKWRAGVFMVEGIRFDDFRLIQKALFAHMASFGIEVDKRMGLAAQGVILPNVPPSNRGKDGQPLFYQNHIEYPANLFDPKASKSIQTAIAEIVKTEAIEDAERAQKAEKAKLKAQAKRAAKNASGGDYVSTLGLFNEQFSVESLLMKYGYTQKRKGSDCWHGEEQTTDSYAFLVRDDVVLSFSGTYADKGWGAEAVSGCRYADAFDLFAFHEHGNDFKKALRAAGDLVTIVDEDTGEVMTANEQYRQKAGAALTAKAEAAAAKRAAMADEDEDETLPSVRYLPLPPRLEAVRECVLATMEYPEMTVATLVTLTFASHVCGRAFYGATGLGFNSYSTIVAPSGYGKGYLFACIRNLMKQAEIANEAYTGWFASAPALHKTMIERPLITCLVDEMGKEWVKMNAPNNSHASGLKPMLLHLFNQTDNSNFVPINQSLTSKLGGIPYPHLSVLGFTTATEAREIITKGATDDGLVNRQIIYPVDKPDRTTKNKTPYIVPKVEKLGQWVSDVRALSAGALFDGARSLQMGWGEGTVELYAGELEDIQDGIKAHDDELVSKMGQRVREIAVKYAAAMSLWDGKTEIQREHLQAAFDFTLDANARMRKWAVLHGATTMGEIQSVAEDVIRKFKIHEFIHQSQIGSKSYKYKTASAEIQTKVLNYLMHTLGAVIRHPQHKARLMLDPEQYPTEETTSC